MSEVRQALVEAARTFADDPSNENRKRLFEAVMRFDPSDMVAGSIASVVSIGAESNAMGTLWTAAALAEEG